MKRFAFVGGLMVLFVTCRVPTGFARPPYMGYYREAFADLPGVKDSKFTCSFCHAGDSKKDLNPYGKKLADELGKGPHPKEKMIEALLKIGAHPAHTPHGPRPPGPPPPLPDPPPPK